ncbi:hypothetical protein ACQ4PT_072200 [Festuca glaucescens]
MRDSLLICKNAHEMLEKIWKGEKQDQLRSLILMWEWWSIRNKANAGEACSSPLEVCHRVEKLAVDFSFLKCTHALTLDPLSAADGRGTAEGGRKRRTSAASSTIDLAMQQQWAWQREEQHQCARGDDAMGKHQMAGAVDGLSSLSCNLPEFHTSVFAGMEGDKPRPAGKMALPPLKLQRPPDPQRN